MLRASFLAAKFRCVLKTRAFHANYRCVKVLLSTEYRYLGTYLRSEGKKTAIGHVFDIHFPPKKKRTYLIPFLEDRHLKKRRKNGEKKKAILNR